MLMYNKFKVFFLGVCVFLAYLTFAHAEEVKTDTEIAILIDVSGSMKQNDPQNLRIPALKLLLNVLPNNVRAGVWMFAEAPNALISMAPVDAVWKQQALQAVAKIHAKGLFTNIEEAIKTATASWSEPQPAVTRNLLLLTDGMVDVSKDTRLSQASKQRVLGELLPKLQQAGIHLQTIALSGNADSQLLQKLASATQGWNETVASAEQLERIFFKMFKQAVPQPAVPLQQGNKFTIDPSIKEFSALIFKKSDQITELQPPNNQARISRGTQSKLVQWLSENNYDMMTIKEPVPGEWHIKADMDPDNQVSIITDLKFELAPLPKYKMKLTPMVFRAHFTDKGELMQKDDFLKLFNIVVKISDGVNEYPDLPLLPDANNKGYFEAVLDTPLEKGTYILKILADGKTFTREISHTLAILDSPITLTTTADPEKRQVHLTLTPDTKVITADSLTLQAQLNQIGHEPKTVDIPRQGEQWQITLDAPEKEAQLIVNFIVGAKTLAGEEVTPELQPLVIDEQLFVHETKPEEHAAETTEHGTEHAASEHEGDVEHKPVDEHAASSELPITENAEPESNWIVSALIVLGINVFLGMAVFFIFRFLKQRAAARQAQLLGRLS